MFAIGNILMRGSGTRMWSRWIYTFWVNISCFLGNPCRIWWGLARKIKTVILYCFLTGFPSWTFANTMTIKQMQNKESIHRCMYVCTQPLCHVWLCYPMDCNPSDTSAHGIFKARILESIAIFSSRGSSQPSDWTLSPALQADFFTTEPLEKSYA